MRSVEWVTVQVRWRKSRGGGVKGAGGVDDGSVAEAVEEAEEEWEYLEGRRRVMGGVMMDREKKKELIDDCRVLSGLSCERGCEVRIVDPGQTDLRWDSISSTGGSRGRCGGPVQTPSGNLRQRCCVMAHGAGDSASPEVLQPAVDGSFDATSSLRHCSRPVCVDIPFQGRAVSAN